MGENPEIISKGYLSLSLAYIKTESDVLKFVTALIANTKGDGKEGDEFWTKAETLLYCEMCIRDRLHAGARSRSSISS